MVTWSHWLIAIHAMVHTDLENPLKTVLSWKNHWESYIVLKTAWIYIEVHEKPLKIKKIWQPLLTPERGVEKRGSFSRPWTKVSHILNCTESRNSIILQKPLKNSKKHFVLKNWNQCNSQMWHRQLIQQLVLKIFVWDLEKVLKSPWILCQEFYMNHECIHLNYL